MKKQLLFAFTLMLVGATAFAKNSAFESGTNGYLNCATNPLSGNASFTIEMWYNGTHSGEQYARLFSCKNNIFEISAGQGSLKFYDGAWRTTGATGLNTGWHHIAITKDGTNTIVYVDGTSVYSKASATLNFQSSINYRILGCVSGNATEKVIGKVDEVKIWNRALTSLEIAVAKNGQISPAQNGLLAYYDFNGTSPYSNKVSGGSLYNLSNVGTTGAVVETNFQDYIKDYSMSFDATDDKLTLPTPVTSGDFTIEMQFKTTAGSTLNYRRLIGFPNYGFDVAITNGRIYTYKGNWSSPSTATFNDGQWHHLAITRSGTTIGIYVDGNHLGNRTLTLSLSGTMYVGGPYATGATDHFGGELDEFRVWNTVRTQPEIEANMNLELAGNESGLIEYLDFNTPASASSVVNLVSTGSTFTRTGASGTNNLPQYVAATKNSITTSVSEIFNTKKELLSVYPNPVNDLVNINVSGVSQILVFDASGKEVLNFNTTSSQIDLSSLNQGVYFLQVLSNEEIKTAKIIKN